MSSKLTTPFTIVCQVFAIVFAAALASHALTYIPVEEIEGPTCVVRDSVTGISLPLSPEISQYNIMITDGFAHIRVTQLYVNRFRNVNDIVYVFPLPHEGSVHAMSMEYDGMLYRAEIYEKQQAKQLYDSAKAIGAVAALLLQDKPNIFQQRLANIAYKDSAYVQIEVSMPLKYNDGEFELAIPTMVAERFGGEQGMPQIGNPWNPPANTEGQRLFINTLIQTGYQVKNVYSPTHPLLVRGIAEGRAMLEKQGLIGSKSKLDMQYNTAVYLKNELTYPNKDFVLRFSRSAAEQDFSLASYYSTSRQEGYFALQLYPGDSTFAGQRPPLEVILLVDVSGSQSGWPLQKEKEIALDILGRLTAGDRFGILKFSNSWQWAFTEKIVDVTSQNSATAQTFINGLVAGGGTQLHQAVKEVLNVEKPSELSRYFIFLTDGFITDEEAILQTISSHPSNPTIFTFGAGGNLNRYFLDRAAEVGNGFSRELTSGDDVKLVVDEAWSKIGAAQLSNITFDFDGLATSDMVLPLSTSLYKGSPIELYGRYTGGGVKTIRIKGIRNNLPVELSKTITLAQSANTNIMIPKIWAKQLIDKLSIEEGTSMSNKDKIIEISTSYQVLSKYTAFLAINPVPVEEGQSIGEDLIGSTDAVVDKTGTMQKLTIRCDGQFLNISLPDGELLEGFAVYDLRGRLIFRIRLDGAAAAGLLRWDGMLHSGKRLLPGRYIIRLTFADKIVTKTVAWR